MNLYVHLTPDDLSPRPPVLRIEKLGAATTDLLADWLTRHTAAGGNVIVRPVLDLNDETAVDQHDPPAAMREHVILRDSHCVFPGCRRDSRTCDLDHITPYLPMDEGGPPGQTNPLEPGTAVPKPPPDQDLHRLGLQDASTRTTGRHLRLDRAHRTPVRGHTRLPTPTTAKNLTPRHPGPPQPGPSARPATRSGGFETLAEGSLLNHRNPRRPTRQTQPPQPQVSSRTTASRDEGVGNATATTRGRRPHTRQTKSPDKPQRWLAEPAHRRGSTDRSRSTSPEARRSVLVVHVGDLLAGGVGGDRARVRPRRLRRRPRRPRCSRRGVGRRR